MSKPPCQHGRVPSEPDRHAASTESLTVLGQAVRHAIDHVECFPAPEHVRSVRFSTDEVGSVCPVTGQPDLSRVVIEYEPAERCVESKSLKLYLWSFRDEGTFHEAVTNRILDDLVAATQPRFMRVTAEFGVRGGIWTNVIAEHRAPDWQAPEKVELP